MSDPLASLALAVYTGSVPEALLAEWSGQGDPVLAMWHTSNDPVAMVDLLEVLGIVGTTAPDELEYDLLERYALEFQPHERHLIEHAVRLARGGHTRGHEAEKLREQLEAAVAETSRSLYAIPLNCAGQLIAREMEHHAVGSEVRTLAALEMSPAYPFSQPMVASMLKQGFPPVTAAAVYAAADRIRRGDAPSRAPAARREERVLHNPSRPKRRR
jgi:hypothetical protein